MKKLSLNKMRLEANDMLQREQLKTVFGGYGGDVSIGSKRCRVEGELCNEHSPNPGDLCCPHLNLECDVSGINIGLCVKKK